MEILKYVRLANVEKGGMVTAGRIQAHLFDKFAIEFKKSTIYYCLNKRLKLKFANSSKPKIVFTVARTRSAITFCCDYDEALKLEAADTHIIVYMDESYVRGNHMCNIYIVFAIAHSQCFAFVENTTASHFVALLFHELWHCTLVLLLHLCHRLLGPFSVSHHFVLLLCRAEC